MFKIVILWSLCFCRWLFLEGNLPNFILREGIGTGSEKQLLRDDAVHSGSVILD